VSGGPPSAPPVGMSPMGSMGGGMMGIQGPVAAGPVAGGSMPGLAPGLAPAAAMGDPSGGDRAQSYRVFAIVLGLVMMVMFGLLVAVGLIFAGVYVQGEKDAAAAIPPPTAAPAPARGRRVDTGAPAPPIAKAPAKPAPRPRPSGGGAAPRPRPAPAPAPAPAPPPTSPAAAVVKVAAGMPYTSVEIKCPSGFRERGSFIDGLSTVANVPREDCKAKFKGGPPASRSITGGQTLSCTDQGGALVCN
jgi:hypothetical protein